MRGDGSDALVVAALADESPRLRDLATAQVRKGAFAPPIEGLQRRLASHLEASGLASAAA